MYVQMYALSDVCVAMCVCACVLMSVCVNVVKDNGVD